MRVIRATSVVELLDEQAGRIPDHPAICWLDHGQRVSVTWQAYRENVRQIASHFLDRGVARGDTVAILAPNVVEHYVADLGAVHCGAATVSLYPTLGADQLAHVLGDARPAVVVISDASAAERVLAALPDDLSPHVICLGDADNLPSGVDLAWSHAVASGARTLDSNAAELARRVADAKADDVATYVYTSGTTGMPKGVILTHANLMYEMEASDQMGFFIGGYRVVSYLPLAHIAERLWSLYFPLRTGGNVLLCSGQDQLAAHLAAQRPSYFMGVPRVWEKLRDGAMRLMASPAYADRADEIATARKVLTDYWDRQNHGTVSPADRLAALRAKEGVLADLRRDLGLDWTINPSCGAAALSEDLRTFWRSLGVSLVQAYGLSETTGVSVWERIDGGSRTSVGYALPGTEISIAGDGEILVRSPGTTPGYRNMPQATAELLMNDGWLATGDVGHLDDDGRLHITDRKKELIVNKAGKNISPTAIEDRVAGRGLVNLAVAVGDDRLYVTALLNLDAAALRDFADSRGIQGSPAELIAHPSVLAEAQRLVDEANGQLSRPEQIKRFHLTLDEWSVDSGDLTPTLKLRRRVLLNRYRDVIDDLYDRPSADTADQNRDAS